MRALFVSLAEYYGGAEEYLARLLARLPSAWPGAEGLALVSPPPLALRLRGLAGLAVRESPASGYAAFPALAREVARAAESIAADVAVFNGNRSIFLSLLAPASVPRVGIQHTALDSGRRGAWRGWLRPPLARAAYRRLDAVIGVCRRSVRPLEGTPVWPRVRVIPNGVDVHLFRPPTEAERRAVRAELGFKPGQPAVYHVGRIDAAEKGQRVTLEAMDRLRRRDAAVCFVGEGPDAAALRAESLRLLGPERVRWLGYRSDVERLLWGADALVLPSRAEGMPLTLLEAMAAGVPAVASRVGGIPELIRHEREGLLLDEPSAAALAGALDRLLCDERLRCRLGALARQRAVSDFSQRESARRVFDLCAGLCAGRVARPSASQ